MALAAVSELVRTAVYRSGPPAEMAAQIRAVVERKLAVYERAPIWCVPELPRRTCRALGLPDDVGDALAAACIVYHCAADIVDDAQDDDLAGNLAWSGDWRDAVTVGLYLLSAHGAMLAAIAAPTDVRAAWALAFGEAGMGLTAGQHRDLRALPDADWTEADVLSLGGEKAGAAVGAFMSLGAIAAGRSDVAAWQALGVTVGQMLQVASDLEAYLVVGPHSDLAQAKLTLPLLAARDMDPGLAALWVDGLPLAPGPQQALRARVRALGGVMYARMRVEALKHEALAQIEALGCPGLLAELLPVLASAELDDEPVPI